MKTIQYLNLVLLLALAACDGCKKDEPKPKTELEKLPPITQEGKNTFGCLVNGKAYVPLSFDSRAIYQLGILQISGKLFSPLREIALILTENGSPLTATDYSLKNYPWIISQAFVSKDATSYCEYKPVDTYDGNITLAKIDRQKYIISGTFEFSTVTRSCDTLKITDGRFDIKYIP